MQSDCKQKFKSIEKALEFIAKEVKDQLKKAAQKDKARDEKQDQDI